MVEIWKPISGYEGIYEISNLGRVKRLTGRNGAVLKEGHILKPNNSRGYLYVGLSTANSGKATTLVHRLVADAFVPNPNGYHEVNHKDENKMNNCADNLEWCSRAYNMAYGTARLRQGVSYGKPVSQSTIDGITIAVYCSAETAGKLIGVDPSSIHKCCKGKREQAGGYVWNYTEREFA